MNFEAVRMVRDLAREQHSRELAQPAARIASVTRSRSAVSLFFKIRGLITDVIATLEARVKDGEDDRDRDGDLTDRPGFDQVCKVQGRNIHIAVCLLDGWISGEDGPVGHLEAETYAKCKAKQEKGLEGIKLAICFQCEVSS